MWQGVLTSTTASSLASDFRWIYQKVGTQASKTTDILTVLGTGSADSVRDDAWRWERLLKEG